MKVRVFYRIQHEIPPRSKETSPEVLEDVRKELTKLKSELELAKNEKDKIRIQRKITRLEQFNDVQEGKITSDKKDEVQKILTGKTTENYLGSDLHLLRKRGVDIASLTLVKESNPAEAAKSSEMNAGDVFIVNFGGNDSLKKKIGAGDILPPEVTKVRINGVECERKNNPRPGFYNEKGKYQPIYDDYKIEVVERRISISPEEIKAADEAAENRWKKVRAQDIVNLNERKPLTVLPEDNNLNSEVEKVLKNQELVGLKEIYNGGEKQKFAVNAFMGLGWTREQAIGIVANLVGESNMDHTVDTGDGGKAYGLAQWHPDRQRDFQRVFGKPIQSSTFEDQISFVNWELRNTEQLAGDMLENANSIEESTRIITYHYERPANKEADTKKRTVIANQIIDTIATV